MKLAGVALVFLVSSALALAAFPSTAAGEISYGRDIRPLLSDRCFTCHGPDPGERQAGLRLDTFEFATRVQDGIAAIVPGDAQASELLRRV
ncbi:MAG: hypothetical protein ACI8X5_003125, partial [Planctomycetota bacterium]